jgi:bifunctional DNA-binding transcriptional regulator/antitoxin component of YhaV-PrlF toxin-antitoxin module
MKDTGIARRIDQLGRIVIPRELLKSHDINMGYGVEIYVLNKDIVVEKADVEDYGIVRYVDQSGRVTIPREIITRYELKLGKKGIKGSAVRFLLDGKKIILRKEVI